MHIKKYIYLFLLLYYIYMCIAKDYGFMHRVWALFIHGWNIKQKRLILQNFTPVKLWFCFRPVCGFSCCTCTAAAAGLPDDLKVKPPAMPLHKRLWRGCIAPGRTCKSHTRLMPSTIDKRMRFEIFRRWHPFQWTIWSVTWTCRFSYAWKHMQSACIIPFDVPFGSGKLSRSTLFPPSQLHRDTHTKWCNIQLWGFD